MDAPNVPAPQPYFFSIGLRKFAILGLFTLGLYQIVWFFHHWRHLRDVGAQSLRPAMRSLFAIVFAFPLAHRIGKASAACRTGIYSVALFSAAAWPFCGCYPESFLMTPFYCCGYRHS